MEHSSTEAPIVRRLKIRLGIVEGESEGVEALSTKRL
jgi:hypothetical protein